MRNLGPVIYFSSHDQGSGSLGGGGPDDRARVPAFVQRSQGFMSLAFGLALGLTFAFFYLIFSEFGAPIQAWESIIADPTLNNLLMVFLFGFVGGTVTAIAYNILIVRHLNLFSLESSGE